MRGASQIIGVDVMQEKYEKGITYKLLIAVDKLSSYP